MNLSQAFTNGEAMKKLADFVTCWLVPLFILFNIVGWVGLPQREADRSDPRLSDQEISDLAKAVWGAWLVGVLIALAGLSALVKLYAWMLSAGLFTDKSLSYAGVWIAGIVGLVSGAARCFLPRIKPFRDLPPIIRKRILSILVICAVALSVACGALYFESATMLRSLIASAYTCLFIGYALTNVLEVGK